MAGGIVARAAQTQRRVLSCGGVMEIGTVTGIVALCVSIGNFYFTQLRKKRSLKLSVTFPTCVGVKRDESYGLAEKGEPRDW